MTRDPGARFKSDFLGDAMRARLGRVAGTLLPDGKAPHTEPPAGAPVAAEEAQAAPGGGFGRGTSGRYPRGRVALDQVRRHVFGG